MDHFHLDDIFETETQNDHTGKIRKTQSKWREIEAIQERRQLQKELMDIDFSKEYRLEDIRF